MPSAFNPKGLTFADLIASADASKAKSDKLKDILAATRGTLDEESIEWLTGLISEHETDERQYRTWAEALSHDPASESSTP